MRSRTATFILKHAKQNSSLLKSDLESTREFGRLQGGPLYSHSERPTVGRPKGDPRCGSTQGRLPAVDLGRALPNLRWGSGASAGLG